MLLHFCFDIEKKENRREKGKQKLKQLTLLVSVYFTLYLRFVTLLCLFIIYFLFILQYILDLVLIRVCLFWLFLLSSLYFFITQDKIQTRDHKLSSYALKFFKTQITVYVCFCYIVQFIKFHITRLLLTI